MKMLLILLVAVSLPGCYGVTHNLKPSEITANKKVLAGRVLFFDNGNFVADPGSRFVLFFNKEGDAVGQALEPDRDGYIYVPVEAGRYNFGFVKVLQSLNGIYNFTLPIFPSAMIRDSDSVVNFGTLKVMFTQSVGSKVQNMLIGFGLANIQIESVRDYNITAEPLSSKLNKENISTVRVELLNRK